MDRCWQHLPLLCMTAVVAMNTLGNNAQVVEMAKLQVKNLTNKGLQVIPRGDNNSSVTNLVIEKNLITLKELDRQALASYPRLVELHLDDNRVTNVSAKYFSVVPHLRVLSLSRNQIINSLDPDSASGLDNLTELDLSHNLLTSLPPQLFRRLIHLKVLNLQGNPWNCSCPLLSTIREIIAARVTIGPNTTCASPKTQAGKDLLEATAKCYLSPPPSSTAHTKHPPGNTTVISMVTSTSPKTTLTSNRNTSINKDQTPARGNTWMFTACVAVLALCISMLIMCAIKGPSWYKLFHNYRHQRLHQEEDDGEDIVSTVFSETRRHLGHQTFSFEHDDGQVAEDEEEEEDGYFEDPYIKREEWHAGEGTSEET